VTVRNEYTLKPGDEFLEIETIVQNDNPTDSSSSTSVTSRAAVVSSRWWRLASGSATVRSGSAARAAIEAGITFDWLGWFGFADAAGISYGDPGEVRRDERVLAIGCGRADHEQGLLDVLTKSDTGSARLDHGTPCSGMDGTNFVVCTINSDCVPPHTATDLGACTNAKPPRALAIPVGGMSSFRRWFALSDNGMGRVVDIRNSLVARGDIVDPVKSGWIQGRVTVVASASMGRGCRSSRHPATSAAIRSDQRHRNQERRSLQGTVPRGELRAAVRSPAILRRWRLVPAAEEHQDRRRGDHRGLRLPPTGFVRVDVTNGVSTNPIPAKVSVVGLETVPDPGTFELIFDPISASGAIFG
jgi:hypothetical protein